MKIMITNCLKFPKTIQLNSTIEVTEPACSPARSAHHYDTTRLALSSASAGKIEACLEQQPLTLRSAYILCEVEGFSIAEAAHMLSTTEEVVKTHLEQAKSSLRKSLRTWYQYTDIYPYDNQSGERIVYQVMNQIDAKSDVPVGVPAF
jgi:RNA polymerase sigma-70 factor (ECF subfamily)